MPALVAGIYAFLLIHAAKTWMAGTSPAMTKKDSKMTPRIRSVGAEAPLVFRDFVRELERLHAPAPKKIEKTKRSVRAKAKPKPRKTRKR
jgi:hypothetical protein